jgi:hypothetical protein
MKKITVKNIKLSKITDEKIFTDGEDSPEQIKTWIDDQVSKNSFGKPARQAIKKGQPNAEDYDDVDVLSEEEKETSPSYERAVYSETETELTSYTDMDGVTQSMSQPKYIGQETIPAKFVTMVNLKAEYAISEIIDLDKDPEYIRQKDIEEANYNLSSGKAIIGLIGGLNLQKQREGTFSISMAEYLTHFSVPFNLLSAGAIDNSLAFLHGLSSMGPYSKEEIEQIKGFHVEAISNRPKR